jgi:glycosyltransferase involved in cell wall biosynthesis
MADAPLVTIILPHFETPELVKLCLRAIRKFTTVPVEVLVIDNGSGDGESLAYLRQVEWIRLIERGSEAAALGGAKAHATALDLGVDEAKGEFVLVMHTDTIPRRAGWLEELVAPFRAVPDLAALGSDKTEESGAAWSLVKKIVDRKTWRRLAFRVTGRELPEELRERRPHARSFCAIYRRAALVKEATQFLPRGRTTAGEEIYHDLAERGYQVRLILGAQMRGLVEHVGHATALVSERRKINRRIVRRRTRGRMERLMSEPWIRELLEDDGLDRL